MGYSRANSAKAENAASGTTLTCQIAVTAGDLIVAGFTCGGADTTCTFSDDAGNSWAEDIHNHNAADGVLVSIGSARAATTGTITVTATLGTARDYRKLMEANYPGAPTTNWKDKTASNNPTGANPTCGPVTPDTDGELIVAVARNTSGVTYAPGGSFQEREEGATMEGQLQDLIQGTAASISSQWTAASAVHTTAMVTYRPLITTTEEVVRRTVTVRGA